MYVGREYERICHMSFTNQYGSVLEHCCVLPSKYHLEGYVRRTKYIRTNGVWFTCAPFSVEDLTGQNEKANRYLCTKLALASPTRVYTDESRSTKSSIRSLACDFLVNNGFHHC